MFPELRSNQSCWQGTAGTVGRGRLAAPPQGPSSCCQYGGAIQMTLEKLGKDCNLLPQCPTKVTPPS